MRKWNGYVCGVGFCCLVAGSALLGVGLTPPTKFKVDPKCDHEVQECERYVTEYDRNNVYYCKIFGIILFTIGVILSAIDLGSCIYVNSVRETLVRTLMTDLGMTGPRDLRSHELGVQKLIVS